MFPAMQALQGLSEELMKNPTPSNFTAQQSGVVAQQTQVESMLGRRSAGEAMPEEPQRERI